MPAARQRHQGKPPMSRLTVAPAYLTVAEVCVVLGLTPKEFRKSYLSRFTDCRPIDKRKSGSPHRIKRSEVETVVEHGWAALAQHQAAGKTARIK